MKKLLLLGLVGLVSQVAAKDISTDTVLLQALDKTTGRTSFLTVHLNQTYEYGDLQILAERCLKHPPEETPENAVFMTITDKDEGDVVFKGWMFSSEPALSAMDHSMYDVWVVDCVERAENPKNTDIISKNE